MTTATAQANPNIAFIKFTLAKLDRANSKSGCEAGEISDRIDFWDATLNVIYESKLGGFMACSPAKTETNSFHNVCSRRAWIRLPL